MLYISCVLCSLVFYNPTALIIPLMYLGDVLVRRRSFIYYHFRLDTRLHESNSGDWRVLVTVNDTRRSWILHLCSACVSKDHSATPKSGEGGDNRVLNHLHLVVLLLQARRY
jgi:hypothetical protein